MAEPQLVAHEAQERLFIRSPKHGSSPARLWHARWKQQDTTANLSATPLHKVQEAADKYIGDVYLQHNPMVADGKEAFVKGIGGFVSQAPQARSHIKRAIAEGDLPVKFRAQVLAEARPL